MASPWLALRLKQRKRGLSAKRIHQDLLVEHSAAAAADGSGTAATAPAEPGAVL